MARSFYSRIESGARKVPRATLAPLCELLHLSPAEAADLYAAAGVPLPRAILDRITPPEAA